MPFGRDGRQLMAWPLPLAPYISNVLVNPLLRRQGLAKRLMLRCEDQARDWGCTQVKKRCYLPRN